MGRTVTCKERSLPPFKEGECIDLQYHNTIVGVQLACVFGLVLYPPTLQLRVHFCLRDILFHSESRWK